MKPDTKNIDVVFEQVIPVKNLYDRLPEEYSIKLDAMATTYPNIYRNIRRALKDTDNVGDLRYEVVSDMRMYLGMDANLLYSTFNS